ncbi:YnfA family protein [Rhizobium sp. 2YAF20]|jgi:small multidrug resistance family-3 protein|uniref:YnfA family protein n=1 Tax=Rhizobium sp. 2YAF20 TaxID=3233027 RepID=UPI003F95F4D4
MPVYLSTGLIFATAAVCEIAGCFSFWAWRRTAHSIYWLAPGLFALVVFAYLLTLIPSEVAGRAYAAYGGIYIVASLLWLWAVEGQQLDRWDLSGSASALIASAIILFAPRGI